MTGTENTIWILVQEQKANNYFTAKYKQLSNPDKIFVQA